MTTFGELAIGELFTVAGTKAIYLKTGSASCAALRGASGEVPTPEPYRYENTEPSLSVFRGCDDLRILVWAARQHAGEAA